MNIRILSTAAASAALAFALPATAQQVSPAGDQTAPQTTAPTDPTTTADPAGLPPAPYPTDQAQPAPDSAGTDTATTPDATTASDAAAPAEEPAVEKKHKKKR